MNEQEKINEVALSAEIFIHSASAKYPFIEKSNLPSAVSS